MFSPYQGRIQDLNLGGGRLNAMESKVKKILRGETCGNIFSYRFKGAYAGTPVLGSAPAYLRT